MEIYIREYLFNYRQEDISRTLYFINSGSQSIKLHQTPFKIISKYAIYENMHCENQTFSSAQTWDTPAFHRLHSASNVKSSKVVSFV